MKKIQISTLLKAGTLALLSLGLMSCHTIPKSKTIAFNKNGTLQLTQKDLSNWLLKNPKEKYSTKELQIKLYFVEKYLISQKHLLVNELIKKINFDRELSLYRNTIVYYKKRIKLKAHIDQNQFDQYFLTMKKNEALKSNKKRIYQIYMKYPLNSTLNEKNMLAKELQGIRSSIHNLDDFKHSAQLYSDSQSRLKKGLIGNIYQGFFKNKLNDIIMQMNPGELSDVIVTKTGLHLFYCESEIPVNIRSDKLLKEILERNLINIDFESKWADFRKDTLDSIDIQISWENVFNDNNDAIVANTELFSIAKQQLMWLMNEDIHLKNHRKENITQSIQSYFFSKHLYGLLDINQKNKLIKDALFHYEKNIAANVMTYFINKELKPATEIELIEYYDQNQNKYINPKSVNFSFIALRFDEQNKKDTYLVAEEILNKLYSGTPFGLFAKQHALFEKRFPKGRVYSMAERNISKVFGVNVHKQINLMKVNETSKIVESKSGYLWILKLHSIEDPRPLNFDESLQFLKKDMGKVKLNTIQNNIIEKIIEKQEITINLAL